MHTSPLTAHDPNEARSHSFLPGKLARALPTIPLIALLLLIVACAGPIRDSRIQPDTAIDISRRTQTGSAVLGWSAVNEGKSGFVPLLNGIDALAARLRLIEKAEVSIDAQYFLIKRDEAAGLFIGKLLRAADRGVRVRLLIDDIFTPELDSELSLFNLHPNVDVRMFNPVSRRGLKFWNFVMDFKRTNRRMHNKSFTVDNSLTIVGGRNIANEYFQINQDVEFIDFDLLGLGPVAEDVAATFDLFWNSSLAVPIEDFDVKVRQSELDIWRDNIAHFIDTGGDSTYARAIESEFLKEISEGRIKPIPADAEVVTDSPSKLKTAAGDSDYQILATELAERFLAAREEVIIVTPYYVPGEAGLAHIRKLRARGIRVVIITNSLASTNHVAVHSGYARYRKDLLRAGVEIFEMRNNLAGTVEDTSRPQTLHSKAAIIDRKTLFIGSLNFDPRSIDINTEMGIFIYAEELAGHLSDKLMERVGAYTYQPYLTEAGSLRWIYRWGDTVEILDKEPQTTPGRRFSAGFYRLLPIENQL